MKLSERHSQASLAKDGLQDGTGHLFFNNYGMTDLSGVEVVLASVDTVRQLFFGIPHEYILACFDQLLEANENVFNLHLPTNGNHFNTEPFHLSKLGKTACYRYKLQNNELGVIIMLGSYYQKPDKEGQHLKIELSPKFISCRSAKSTMHYMTQISDKLMKQFTPQGCSVHLACDYQNFTLPDDFVQRLSTYSRTVKTYDGIADLDLSNLTESIATYGGKNQERNYLIGKVNSVQLAVYDKSYEIIKSDKVDYFHDEWSVYSLGVYDPRNTVRRIEARIHHQVIREIGQGLGISLESFVDVSNYLTDIWRYALKINRLNIMPGKDLIHPFWQLLLEDVQFTVPAQNIAIARKKKDSVDPISRNITSLLGNFISLCYRQGYEADDIMIHLKVLPFYPRIKQYYKQRGVPEEGIRDLVKQGVTKRRMLSKIAA